MGRSDVTGAAEEEDTVSTKTPSRVDHAGVHAGDIAGETVDTTALEGYAVEVFLEPTPGDVPMKYT